MLKGGGQAPGPLSGAYTHELLRTVEVKPDEVLVLVLEVKPDEPPKF